MTNGLFGGCFGHFNMYHHLKGPAAAAAAARQGSSGSSGESSSGKPDEKADKTAPGPPVTMNPFLMASKMRLPQSKVNRI